MEYIWNYTSRMGKMMMASDGENLTGLWFEEQQYYASTLSDKVVEKNLPVFEKTIEWLERYFQGENPDIEEIPMAPMGSEFRKSVWKILCEIPYGKTVTYGEIAKRIATERGIERMSAQAIGGAVGHNPISIIIPCHRVIGSDGSLTGYAGGLGLKRKLLEHERANIPKK